MTKLLTPEQVCEMLGCGKTKLKSLQLAYVKIGGNRRYRETDLQNYINQNTVVPEGDKLCHLPKGKTRRSGGTHFRSMELGLEHLLSQPIKSLPLNMRPRPEMKLIHSIN